MNTSRYGRCLVPESVPREHPGFPKPHIVFNKRIIVPTAQEGRCDLLSMRDAFGFPDNVSFYNVFDVYEFDNYAFDNVILRTWRYFMYLDSYLRSVFRDRLKEKASDWATILKSCYPEGYIVPNVKEADAIDYAASKAQEIAVGHAMARSRSASFAGDPLQARLQSMDIFHRLPEPLRSACDYVSAYKPERFSDEIESVISMIEDVFVTSLDGRLMSFDVSGVGTALFREIPSLRRLSFEEVVRLHDHVYDTNRITSIYDWLLRYSERKRIDFASCSVGDIASLLQDAVWELASKVEPNPPMEIAKVFISNIPLPVINPVGIIIDTAEVAREIKVQSDYRGLFVLAGLTRYVHHRGARVAVSRLIRGDNLRRSRLRTWAWRVIAFTLVLAVVGLTVLLLVHFG